MKKLKLLFKQKDKIKHLIAGGLIGFITSIFLDFINLNQIFILVVSIILAFIVGALKEKFDFQTERGVSDKYDTIATAIGGVIGALIFQLIILI